LEKGIKKIVFDRSGYLIMGVLRHWQRLPGKLGILRSAEMLNVLSLDEM
jgi:hypothetical protein